MSRYPEVKKIEVCPFTFEHCANQECEFCQTRLHGLEEIRKKAVEDFKFQLWQERQLAGE